MELAIATASLVVGVVAAYFTYLQTRQRRRPSPRPPGDGDYDLYISYAPANVNQARELADRVIAARLRPFLVEWLLPGVIQTLGVEDAMARSAHAVLLYSHASRRDTVMDEEHAALLRQTRNSGNRFIPAKLDDVELPPFAAIRVPIDLTGGDPARYDAEVARVIEAIRRA